MYLKEFTLLYVEDEKESRDLMTSILESEVKELFVAKNGREGLELFKKYNPDIILTDIAMPIMNGLEMVREIRKIDKDKMIAILTAFNEVEYLKEAIELKIDKYLLKPLEEVSFFDTLDSMAKSLQFDINKDELEKILREENKIKDMGKMLENIAHQWRQPLSVITSLASSINVDIQMGKDLSEDRISYCVNEITNQAKHLSQTIDDFMGFLRADGLGHRVISLKEIVESTYKLVEESFKNNHIICIQDIDDVYIEGDKNIFKQSLINIFTNAKDSIAQSNAEDRYLFFSVKKEEDNTIITVRDSGEGIKEENLSKIFEPYFTNKDKNLGTGIGLYMTWKYITKNFNGHIEAKNVKFELDGKKLEGAEFRITIPLAKGK